MRILKNVMLAVVIIYFLQEDTYAIFAVLLAIFVPSGTSAYLEKHRPTEKKHFDIEETDASDNETMSDWRRGLSIIKRHGALSIISWSVAGLAMISAVVARVHGRIGLLVTVALLIVHVATRWIVHSREMKQQEEEGESSPDD